MTFRRWTPALLGCFVLALFWPSLTGGFQWDDRYLFLVNSRFGSWDLGWMFTTFHMGHCAPLSWLSWTLDNALWGGAPAGFHLTNVLLHGANAALLFLLARRLIAAGTGAGPSAALDGAAAAAALLYAAHPLRVESVAWITERRGLLCAFFSLGAVLADASSRGPDGAPSARGRAVSFCLFLAALLSKAAAMALPIVFLVLDVHPFNRSLRDGRVWRERSPFFVAAFLFTVLAGAAQRETGAALSWEDHGPLQRLAQAAYAPVFLLAKTVWPAGLSPLYELRANFDSLAFPFPQAALTLGLLAAAVFFFRRKFPALAAAGVCFLAFLAPTSGVFQSGPQLVADRYATLSSLGLAVAAGAGLHGVFKRGGAAARGAAALLVFLAALLSALTWRQQAYWRTPLALWDRAVALDPASPVARYNKGLALQDSGRWAEALEEQRTALRLHPTLHQAAYNAGWLYQKTGDLRRAEAFYRLTVWMKPDHADACNNLGGLLLERGRPAEAAALFRRAAALDPGRPAFRLNLARALAAGAGGEVPR